MPPRAGYDFIIQGMGGIMDADRRAGRARRRRPASPIADIFTGLYAADRDPRRACAAATRPARGCHIDMALLDTQVAVLANQAMNYLVSGEAPRRLGNAHPNIAPYQAFAVADGHVIVAVGNDGSSQRLCALLGRRAGRGRALRDQCRPGRQPRRRSIAAARAR